MNILILIFSWTVANLLLGTSQGVKLVYRGYRVGVCLTLLETPAPNFAFFVLKRILENI